MKSTCVPILKRNWLYAFADWWERNRHLGRIWFTLLYVVPVYSGIMLLFWIIFNTQVVSWVPFIYFFDHNYLVVVLLLYPVLGYILGSWVYWFCEKTYFRATTEEEDEEARTAAWAETRKHGILYHVVLRGMLRDGLILAVFFAGQPLPYVLNLYSYTLMVQSRVGALGAGAEALEAFLFGPFLWYLIIPLGALVGASIYYWRFEIRYRTWSETRNTKP